MSRRCARRCRRSRSPAPRCSSSVTASSAPMIAGRSRSRFARCRSCAPRPWATGRIPSPRRSSCGPNRCPILARARFGSCGSISRPTAPRRATTSLNTPRSRCVRSFPRSRVCRRLPTTKGERSSTCRARRGPRETRARPCASCRRSTRSSCAHRDRSRIVPPEYVDVVFNKRNATTKNTFTVDGFVAGAWRIERKQLTIESFAPLPTRVRREVDAEGERLLAWYLG